MIRPLLTTDLSRGTGFSLKVYVSVSAKVCFVWQSQSSPFANLRNGSESLQCGGISSLPDVDWLLGDRGYDAVWFRESLKGKGIRACIPRTQETSEARQAPL